MRIAAPASIAVFLNRPAHFAQHRPAQDDRVAQIAVDDPRRPEAVLQHDRLIEPQLMAELLDLLGAGVGPEHDLGGIAGRDVDEAEDDDRDADDDHDHPEEAADQISSHALLQTDPIGTEETREPSWIVRGTMIGETRDGVNGMNRYRQLACSRKS